MSTTPPTPTSASSSTPEPEPSSFFSSFRDFVHNPRASISGEFARLGAQRRWKQGSKTWRKNWDRCMSLEFDRLVGCGGLGDWVDLCLELGVHGGGRLTSIRQCKMALARVNVNIVDFLDSRATGQIVQKFPSVSALREYTRRTGKLVPRDVVKQCNLLKVLLKQMT
ncbi:hypothetical protein PHISP_05956 [Aspergillus sp. HF37]|nr:hypothetical protein PHISP_05956 [Aspergillus sp. HF37]